MEPPTCLRLLNGPAYCSGNALYKLLNDDMQKWFESLTLICLQAKKVPPVSKVLHLVFICDK